MKMRYLAVLGRLGHGLFLFLFLCLSFGISAQNTFQLAPPYLKYESVFFEKEAVVKLEFAEAGTQIHYTTNGLEPTEKDPVYRKPLRIKKHNTELKAKVFGAGFLASEVVSARFYQNGLAIKSISTPPAHARYPGTGATCLIDGKGGNANLSSPNWMGFQEGPINIEIDFGKPQKVQEILLHVLENQGAWIFQPLKIELYSVRGDFEEWVLQDQKIYNSTEKAEKSQCKALFFQLPNPVSTNQIILSIYPLANLPEWHPGHSKPAWLFLDEIKIY